MRRILACLLIIFLAASATQVVAQEKKSASAPSAPGTVELKPVSMKRSEVLQIRTKRARLAPLRIEAAEGPDILVKLVEAKTGKEIMLLYVKGGDAFETKAPLGDYVIRGATGDTWYGASARFGPDTRYFKFEDKNADTTKIFRFTTGKSWKEKKGNNIITYTNYNGHTLQLKPIVDGNMESQTISENEF